MKIKMLLLIKDELPEYGLDVVTEAYNGCREAFGKLWDTMAFTEQVNCVWCWILGSNNGSGKD